MSRLIDADALGCRLQEAVEFQEKYDNYEGSELLEMAMDIVNEQPTVEAIPVDWLMQYAQLPTEFAIQAWRKPKKEARKTVAKNMDKPMSFDDAIQFINAVLPYPYEEINDAFD